MGIAGSKDDVFKTKAVIKEILKYHHSELSHPDTIHEEVVVPPEYLSYVIGSKGSG